MDKPRVNKSAFTLVESLITLLICGILMALTVSYVPQYSSLDGVDDLLASELMKLQSEAMTRGERRMLEIHDDRINNLIINGQIEGLDVGINGRGNVDKSETILVFNEQEEKEIVIWLGTGRVRREMP